MPSLPLPVTLAALVVLLVLYSIRKDSSLIFFAICGVILKINYDIGPIPLTISLVFGCFLFFVATWILNPKSIHIKPLPFALISCAAIILAIQGWMSPVNQRAQQEDATYFSSDSSSAQIVDPLGIYSADELLKLQSIIQKRIRLYNGFIEFKCENASNTSRCEQSVREGFTQNQYIITDGNDYSGSYGFTYMLIFYLLPSFFWASSKFKNIAKKIGFEPSLRISFTVFMVIPVAIKMPSLFSQNPSLMFFTQTSIFIFIIFGIVNFFFFLWAFGAITYSISTKEHNKKIVQNAFFVCLGIISCISIFHINMIIVSLMTSAISEDSFSDAFSENPIIGSFKSVYFYLSNFYYDKEFHKPFIFWSAMSAVLFPVLLEINAAEVIVNEKHVFDGLEWHRVSDPNEREQWQNKFGSNAENDNLLNAMSESDIDRDTILITLDKIHRSPLLRSIFIKKNAKDENSIYDV